MRKKLPTMSVLSKNSNKLFCSKCAGTLPLPVRFIKPSTHFCSIFLWQTNTLLTHLELLLLLKRKIKPRKLETLLFIFQECRGHCDRKRREFLLKIMVVIMSSSSSFSVVCRKLGENSNSPNWKHITFRQFVGIRAWRGGGRRVNQVDKIK